MYCSYSRIGINQREQIILADFDLADSQVPSSHVQNLPARVHLRQHCGYTGYTSSHHPNEQAAYKGIILARIFEVQSLLRDYRKRALKDWYAVAVIRAKNVALIVLLEPKDHTHQVTWRCAIAFMYAKYGNDLILGDLIWRLAGRSAKPPNFPAIL